MKYLHYSPESSSVIKLLVYDVNQQILAVQFHSNTIWLYYEVDLEIVDGLTSAKSVGQYFNLHIRNIYHGEKVVDVSEYAKKLGLTIAQEE